MKLRGKIKYYQDKYLPLFTKVDQKLLSLPLEELLELRLCDLKLSLQGGPIASARKRFESEWGKTRFQWKPYYWLSREWFHPEGTNGIAIPFYLAHPTLMALEEAFFLELEGKNTQDILKYLRHEAGHIIDKIYQVRYDKQRRTLFGKSSEKYPKTYHPTMFTSRFVKNLPRHYGQTHPDEDFAETFAIWLNPKSQWKKKYRGTARKKLEYIDQTMKTIKKRPTVCVLKDRLENVATSRMKLKTYYQRKAKGMGLKWADIEKQIITNPEITKQKIKALVIKYAKSKTLTNYELRYLLSDKHSPLLRSSQLLNYSQEKNLKALKKQIQKIQKRIEKKGIYFST